MDDSVFAQDVGREPISVIARSVRIACPFGADDDTAGLAPDDVTVPVRTIDGPPYWGVDSVAPADRPFGDSPTLYDYVLSRSNGRPPAFFGRYLTPADTQRVTDSERAFLSQRSCKLILNYNQLRRATVETPGAKGRESGTHHANAAADLASGPGIEAPANVGAPTVWLYANIDELYNPTVEWIAGWWEGLWGRGYGPGIYFPAGKDSVKVANAMKVCSVPDIRAWCSVWSWAGQSKGSTNVEKNQFTTNLPPAYADCVHVWQYGAQCFKYAGDKTRSFDMNLATEVGYGRMWEC
jgi:hypothetical protein